MTTSAVCSIWLMPSGQVCDRLSSLIAGLSDLYATPCFPPHVTLISGLAGNADELTSRTKQLASIIQPFEIVLTNFDYLDEYFRCLFLRVEESPALLEADQAARVMFNREQGLPFMPHLSLIYGRLSMEAKKQIIRSIGTGSNLTFQAHSLHLYSTAGEPKEWRQVQEFKIPG